MIKNTNCRECGKELVKRQKVFCSVYCKLSNKEFLNKRNSPKEKLNPNLAAICKITGKYYNDYKNYSGALTRHLRNFNIELKDISEHFDIVPNPNASKLTYNCKYCDWKTTDVVNKTGCITSHIEDVHKISIENHIKKYTQDVKYFLKNKLIFIECQICGKKLKKLTISHLNKHKLNVIQ